MYLRCLRHGLELAVEVVSVKMNFPVIGSYLTLLSEIERIVMMLTSKEAFEDVERWGFVDEE